MLDKLDVINDAIKEPPLFNQHPAKRLNLGERLLYLKALALLMSIDKKIRDEEERYFRILHRSLDLANSELAGIIRFAQRPDAETMQAFFKFFRRLPLAQLFLFDAYMLTRLDDQSNLKEREAIDKFALKLEVLKGTQRDIYDLFCHIKNRNWTESAVYFNSHRLIPEHFKHLLDYFEVDFDQLMADTEALRQNRLMIIIKRHIGFNQLQWGQLSYRDVSIPCRHTQITSEPVKELLSFNYAVMVPYLRTLLAKRLLRINDDIGYLTQNDAEVEVLSLSQTGLVYDPETESLYKALDRDENDKVTWELPLLVELLGLDLSVDVFAQLEQITQFLGCSYPKVFIQNNRYHLPRCDDKVSINRHPLEVNGNIWTPVAVAGKSKLSCNWLGVLAERGMDDEWPTIRSANGALELWEEDGIGSGSSVAMDKNECKQGPEWRTKGMDPYSRPWFLPSTEAGFNFHTRRDKCLKNADIRALCRHGIYLIR